MDIRPMLTNDERSKAKPVIFQTIILQVFGKDRYNLNDIKNLDISGQKSDVVR